jgi:hypothetical protein
LAKGLHNGGGEHSNKCNGGGMDGTARLRTFEGCTCEAVEAHGYRCRRCLERIEIRLSTTLQIISCAVLTLDESKASIHQRCSSASYVVR